MYKRQTLKSALVVHFILDFVVTVGQRLSIGFVSGQLCSQGKIVTLCSARNFMAVAPCTKQNFHQGTSPQVVENFCFQGLSILLLFCNSFVQYKRFQLVYKTCITDALRLAACSSQLIFTVRTDHSFQLLSR